MEPLFFKAENAMAELQRAITETLQWSRFFSKRKMTWRCPCVGLMTRFNGAAFFQSGKYGELVLVRAVVRGFNGAAFFQSGK